MVIKLMPYTITCYGLSDIGLVRENNEDVWAELPEIHTYILADGMGGHRAGEVAAKQAVSFFSDHMAKLLQGFLETPMSLGEVRGEIEHALQLVNHHVYKMGCKDPELKGMGTTFCCLHFHPQGVVQAHIGDSRIYRLREGELEQLTNDHSLVRELVDLGQLDDQEARDFHYKNIITKAVGTEAYVEPSVYVTDVAIGDLYLLCSDGLSDLIPSEQIEELLNEKGSIQERGNSLVVAAKNKGGHDNITVVVLEVEDVRHGGKDLL